MRLVLDTDVILSGLRSTLGASRVLLLAVEAGVVTPLVNVAVVLEYEAVLKRPAQLEAMGLDADDVDVFLDDFIRRSEQVHSATRSRPNVRDDNDEMFAELAINGDPEALVTFNVADYRTPSAGRTRLSTPVCRPGDILRRFDWRP